MTFFKSNLIIMTKGGEAMKTVKIPLIIALFLVLYFMSCAQPPSSPVNSVQSSTSNSGSSNDSDSDSDLNTTGFFQIVLKDKPIDNAVNIFVTIDKIRIHKASPENFILVSEELQEFDLLELKKNPQSIVETELEAGHYNQIRMSVVSGRIIIDEEGELVEYEMNVSSGDIKVPVQFKLEENGTVQITLDFDTEKSIHVNKKGQKNEYTLRPVIKVEGLNNS